MASPLTDEDRKNLACDYTPSPSLPVTTSEPLVLESGLLAPRLSPRGASVLVQAANASLHATSDQSATTKLSSYVADILNLANIDLIFTLNDFGPSVRHWSPAMHEHVLKQSADIIILKHPLLALGAWLVTSPPADDQRRSDLYAALKQIVAILQSRSEASMEMLQLGLSLAVYEVGHGMTLQAFQTLSGCKAMLILLERDIHKKDDEELQETIEWLKASLLMLDRILFITTLPGSLPLTISPGDLICGTLSAEYSRITPGLPPGRPPSRLHLRNIVALASGHALEYLNALQRNISPSESHDVVEDHISACIKMLLDNPQPSTWLHCDAIALGFCSNLLLQQEQLRHLARLPCSNALDERKEKVHLTLMFGRRMAWDMVRAALGSVDSKEEAARLPFAALCCVLRAGLAVLETSRLNDSELVSREEVTKLQRVVGWFAARWGIGRQFEMKLADIIRELSF
ncbi:hypothetical protein E8E11_005863 [Didymella keratinophila]|nr:hypothetical protein E8E11_005863 [Didymella keratinophila]